MTSGTPAAPVCDGCPCQRLTVRLSMAERTAIEERAAESGRSVNSVFRSLAAHLARFKLVQSGDVLVFEDLEASPAARP